MPHTNAKEGDDLPPQKTKRPDVWLPIALAATMGIGMYLGVKFNDKQHTATPLVRASAPTPLQEVLNYVNRQYVDTVDADFLYESGIESMLSQLDPYSVYIPARDLQTVNEDLEGNFVGIGVEFHILNDTMFVVSPMVGSPAESAGIRSGDRIVQIDKMTVAGAGLQDDQIVNLLRGKQGTTINLKLIRQNKTLNFSIQRDAINTNSVDVAYMINNEIGYIKINEFNDQTADEFNKALQKLKRQNLQKLVLDLRGNPGGYVDEAVQLADEFLEDKKLIVYTKGRNQQTEQYFASAEGSFEQGALTLLIDEGTASASEIMSGAIQDWDRGIIVGRRSFGKGLVQQQYDLPNGSALRLTVSRYYTPTGRSIQKPYTNRTVYDNEIDSRNAELYSPDSIPIADTLKYKTPSGRTVYGGGGIIPDVFVPLDSSWNSIRFAQLFNTGILLNYAYSYSEKHQELIRLFRTGQHFANNFKITQSEFNQFLIYLNKNKIQTNRFSNKDHYLIALYLKAYIGRQTYGNEAFYMVIDEMDNALQKAVDILKHIKPNDNKISGKTNLQNTLKNYNKAKY